MTQETKTKKAVEFKTGFCKHRENEYSLNIEFEDCQATMTTYNYSHKIGYNIGLSIFNLSLDDMTNLASKIHEQVFIIRQEEKAKVEVK